VWYYATMASSKYADTFLTLMRIAASWEPQCLNAI
jgi:hypothetical protein